MAHIPASRLAELPATQWEQAKRRVAVVRRYLEEGDTSLAAVIRHASELRIGRGMFYRLVRTVRSWDEYPIRPRRPRAFADAGAAETALEAVERAGPPAILEDVVRIAIDIATEKGIEPPGERAIRRAHDSVRAGPAIAERLGIADDLVMDAAALALTVQRPDGIVLPVVLTAVLEARSGDVVAWRATEGEADAREVVDLVLEARRVSAGSRTLVFSSAIPTDARPRIARAHRNGPGRRIPAGYALKAALGSRIGRIPLLPRLLGRGGGGDLPFVQSHDVRNVVDELFKATADRV